MLTALILSAAVVSQTSCPCGQSARPVPLHRQAGQTAPVASRPVAIVPTAPRPAVAYEGDGPAVFLTIINAERARHGRRALVWDSTLAAYASRNTSSLADPRYRGHSPWSMAPGASGQCWAGCRSYSQAAYMWLRSPAHRAIILNATVSIGVAPCPSGMTANTR